MKNYKYTLAVVIPCWNEEKLLPEMLECLLKQTFCDWRAFCVDDTSTDSTAEVIKGYQEKDNRINYFCRNREPKSGQTCRNIGLELSTDAKYIVFFDADDLVAPYCFEQRVNFMEAHPNIDLGVFPMLAITNSITEESGPVFGVKTFDDDLEAMLAFHVPLQTATNIYRRDSLISNHIEYDLNIKSYQDVDFNIQLLIRGLKYDYDTNAKADFFYRVDYNGVAGQINTKQHFDSHLYFLDKVTQDVSGIYGKKYDFYLEAMIVNFLGLFKKYWSPYFKLLQLPWIKKRKSFVCRIILYLMIFKLDRRIIFMKYRRYSKLQNSIWRKAMAVKLNNLLDRGVEV